MNQVLLTQPVVMTRKTKVVAFLGCMLCLGTLATVWTASGATVYVRDGASGNGSSWSNPLGDLPSSMNSGDTYYVAEGNYRSGAISGTVKRATATDHGSDSGWQNSYDGQAVFNAPLTFGSDSTSFDGATWEGFRLDCDTVTGGCPACGSMRITGDSVTIRNTLLAGTYGGGFGHSVGVTGSDTTFELCHFYKTYYEDTFGGEPKGTFTLRSCVVQMPNPPDDGSHRDVFNPYTGSASWNLVLENNIFNDVWLFSFLMQQSGQMGTITVRENVICNGGAHLIRFGSGNGGVASALFENNTFYNVIDYQGSSSTHRNNIYAKSSTWRDTWGGSDVHGSGSTEDCLFWTNPTDFVNVNDPMGPDGVPFTADDGFRLNSGSEAIGAAGDGGDVGAYQFSSSGSTAPAPPSNLRFASEG